MRTSLRHAAAPLLATSALAVLALTLAACGSDSGSSASPSPSPSAAGVKTISYTKVVDLQHVITEKIPLWPGDPKVVFTPVATFAADGYFLRKFSIGEHSATHMNAPNSFHANGADITSYTPEQLVVPAVVIDVREQCAADADYQMTQQDVLDWEAQHGQIEPGTFVIMYTGWQDKWSDAKAFFNIDAKGNLHFPGFAGATTEWLLAERDIAGVGIDTHGVDPGLDTSYATNTQVTGENKIILECLANLDQLPPTGSTLVLGILRLAKGSGTPLAVTAFVP